MNDDSRLSKTLSYVLRHQPEAFGLALDAAGWVGTDDLLAALRSRGHRVSRADLERVVRASDKQRFALSEDGRSIRANQGHSTPVELGYEPREPPARLYHGTVARFVASIRMHGLQKGQRHHVHLSESPETAIAVGARRGRPVVLLIDAAAMHAAGHSFFCSANGVWLTEQVPAAYVLVLAEVSER
ncbi:MAG: RNA 2'-phosphotransferase [Myxococcales bacterium]